MGMERVGRAERGWAEVAQGWTRQRLRAGLVWQRLRRWADSGSTAPLVHPPHNHPRDIPADQG